MLIRLTMGELFDYAYYTCHVDHSFRRLGLE
jgi:hypothetical protein